MDDATRERSAEQRDITAPTPDVRAKADDKDEADDRDEDGDDEPPAADTQAP
ncbi:hypothetical protein [Streptomyces sp. CBMA123]|uniref:hypothetical protein n=1 Tax=Streptomyces sp. CBMA123 TaxID=1896313 RepID=UPI0016619767|nr:hypothetical protein [Streptomyces sp. CBMA123]